MTKTAAANPLFGDYPPIFGYYLHECRAVGGWAEASTRAMRGYAAREQTFLEKALATQLVGSTAISSDCPEKALAEAEEYLDSTYAGDGVIHLGSAVASSLGSRLQRQGNHIETRLGTPVAIGAYGNRVLATGAVTIRRSAATTTPARCCRPPQRRTRSAPSWSGPTSSTPTARPHSLASSPFPARELHIHKQHLWI